MNQFLCYVYPPDPDDRYSQFEEGPIIYPGYPLNVPADRGSMLAWQLEAEAYIACACEANVPPEGGHYWLELGTDTDHEGHIDDIWVEAMRPAGPNEVHEALCTRVAQEIHEDELRLKVGCDCLIAESWHDREPQCHHAQRNAFRSPLGCTRKPGQICTDGDWSPNEMATWEWPKNHFLDGTGVCRWVGQPYNEDFAGHELHPTPQEIIERWDDDTQPPWKKQGVPPPTLDEVTVAWEVTFERALEMGELVFAVLIVPTDDRPQQWVSVRPQANNRGATCDHCTGLPLYESDCPFYDERALAGDEIILPVVAHDRTACWRFRVRKIHSDEGRWISWQRRGEAIMYAVDGVPVTGIEPPTGRHIPQFERKIAQARETVNELKWQWDRLHAVSDLLGEILMDNPRWGKTVEQVLKSVWLHLLREELWLSKAVKGVSYANVLSLFPWEKWNEPNWGGIARDALSKGIRLHTLIHGYRPGDLYGPILFPARVDDPWLRWAYGLVGAPANLGQKDWERGWKPDGSPDDPAHAEAVGRRMTQKAFDRLRATWYARYNKSRWR